MFKKIGFILVLFFSISVHAQESLNSVEAKSLRENIIKKSNTITTIASNFTQAKHLSFLSKDIISKGKLVFKAPNLIKWEYKTPFKYSVIFKNDKLLINDDGTKSDIDLSANKAFKSLNDLIIKSIKGNMFDDEQFTITYYKTQTNYMVSFKAKDNKLQAFITKFELTFHKKTFQVLKVKMIETSDDYTSIQFNKQLLNKPVNEEIFSN